MLVLLTYRDYWRAESVDREKDGEQRGRRGWEREGGDGGCLEIEMEMGGRVDRKEGGWGERRVTRARCFLIMAVCTLLLCVSLQLSWVT